MNSALITRLPFLLFFLSGFCGLLYQVVWLRLAFRSFGVITPVLSVVISVFMLGLALGSWGGGRWIGRLTEKSGRSPIIYYAVAELLIGVGAFVVPWFFSLSETYLLGFGEMNSFSYLLVSALLISVCILPWCILMGVTFPVMMAFFKSVDSAERTSFSFLYLANVIGAMCGTVVTALVLIELLGFRNTLAVAGLTNFAIAVIAFTLKGVKPRTQVIDSLREHGAKVVRVAGAPALLLAVLFTTGLVSMGVEVVWIRAYTPVLRTTVYAFALLLSVYLLATWVGSFYYRRGLANGSVVKTTTLLGLLSVTAFLPIIINDPRINAASPVLLLATIFPVCAVLGYLTPKLIDEYSGGDARLAGRAYAVNIIGCIIGPILASYILLPMLGSRYSMVLLAVPFCLFAIFCRGGFGKLRPIGVVAIVVSVIFFISSIFVSLGYEDRFQTMNFSRDGVTRRDHTATITAYGEGPNKRLFVNGISITYLTTITKMMAHLPLVMLNHEPKSALVICFGMGTTYRSLMSWPIDVTAVELVPSVPDLLGYFHEDADELMNDPRGNVVVDDGRRFLKRTGQKFDVITIDPPPPIEAAGSSFLYSRDFYDIVKLRLNEGGILQHWYPDDDEYILRAVITSLTDAFPYVRVYDSVENWGLHFLASMSPIEEYPDMSRLAMKMPAPARADMLEWTSSKKSIESQFEKMFRYSNTAGNIARELRGEEGVMLTDDHPVNEYYKLRRSGF